MKKQLPAEPTVQARYQCRKLGQSSENGPWEGNCGLTATNTIEGHHRTVALFNRRDEKKGLVWRWDHVLPGDIDYVQPKQKKAKGSNGKRFSIHRFIKLESRILSLFDPTCRGVDKDTRIRIGQVVIAMMLAEGYNVETTKHVNPGMLTGYVVELATEIQKGRK